MKLLKSQLIRPAISISSVILRTLTHWDISYRKSTDGGSTWTPSKRITYTFGEDSAFPVIAADPSGNIHVVWEEHVWADDTRIYYKKSSDSGATWSAIKKLSWVAGESI